MDTLSILGLTIPTHIGVHDWGQRIKRTLTVDIHLTREFANCKDELSNTIDYDALSQKIVSHVSQTAFKLIESVAERVCAIVKEHCDCQSVTVSVSKPHAIASAKEVKITLCR